MKKSLDNIFLVGPMGAGKTTIGRLLAEEMHLEFVDSDHEIEARTGANISWIFDMEGEEGFRIREQKMIEELTEMKKIVLATGGGAILSEQNRRFLQSRGTVVYLMTTINQQVERTHRDQKRPLIQNVDDPKAKLTELMEERDPLYREVADHVIMTSKRSPKAVSAEIVSYLLDVDSGNE
jgi:shikimate kinase